MDELIKKRIRDLEDEVEYLRVDLDLEKHKTKVLSETNEMLKAHIEEMEKSFKELSELYERRYLRESK